MDFLWTEADQAYRERVRDFLRRELPKNWPDIARHGPGSREQTEFSLEFCPKLAKEGLLVPHWPAEWGGSDRPAWEHFILGEEMWAAAEPRGAQYMNVNWIGPTLMRFGTEEQKRIHLPAMAAGKAVIFTISQMHLGACPGVRFQPVPVTPLGVFFRHRVWHP